MEQPWTLEILSYYPSSLNNSVFQAVQPGWTIHRTHEMFSFDPCSLNCSVIQAVRLDGTTLNSWNIVLWPLFPLFLDIWSSSPGWNNPELMKDCPIIPFPELLGSSSSSTGLNYTPNLRNVFLRFLFPQLHDSSSISACFIKPTHMGHYAMFPIPLITR